MTKTLTITDFIRRFGEYSNLLQTLDKIILTRDGVPFAEIRATPEEKNKNLLSVLGGFDASLFSDDKVWEEVAVRRNRKKPIKI